MTLWRISRYAQIDGMGGLLASGRWHHRGRRVVYCAPNPATALLETLVHAEIDIGDVPVSFQLLEIQGPEITAERVDVSSLPVDWAQRLEVTRRIGDTWLSGGRTALLSVPCVVVPATSNLLLNPLHPDAATFSVVKSHLFTLDDRLL